MLNTINPDELGNEDVLEIETDEVPEEIVGNFSDDFDQEEETEQVNFNDDGKDSDEDEEKPVVVVPRTKQTKMRKGEWLETVKKVPLKGQKYKAKYFTIEIIGKNGKTAVCKVIQAVEQSGFAIGDEFEAEEVAFYSDYYTISY